MDQEQRYSSVLKELEDISQEVNFISLNAHIEASKAPGSSGRRFSIVAQEMNKIHKKLDISLYELKKVCERK
jgi:methyl-accepting chemotaxis protein